MLPQIIDQANQTAPQMSRPRFLSPVQLGSIPADAKGENRLGFGGQAVNGFTITGCEAHAAVRMHATPASGTPWSYDRKGTTVATTSSAGKLRTS